jgi:hypothetical protein
MQISCCLLQEKLRSELHNHTFFDVRMPASVERLSLTKTLKMSTEPRTELRATLIYFETHTSDNMRRDNFAYRHLTLYILY